MRQPPVLINPPPPERPVPLTATPLNLWQMLTPQQRQQMAQGLAELIQRMRQPCTPTSTESHHD